MLSEEGHRLEQFLCKAAAAYSISAVEGQFKKRHRMTVQSPFYEIYPNGLVDLGQ